MFSVVEFRAVREVREGYATDTFHRREKSFGFSAQYPADRCFSLILNDGRTVDLIAPDKATQKMCINVLRRLIDKAQQANREERLERYII